MKKAIILARVSTKEQEETGLSIEKIQLPQMRQYAKDKDFEVVKEFIFQETASDKLRKQFDAMIEFLQKDHTVVAIIGFRVDRLTRNFRDAVKMDELRQNYDKELHFVNDHLVLTKDTHGTKITEWDTKVYLAKQLINRCQEDAYNTHLSKLEAGELYGKASYGYENYTDKDGNQSVRKVPFEAGIVKKIFDLYTTGAYSYLKITIELNEEFNTNLYKGKVEKIINNPFYYGMMRYKDKLYPHKYEIVIKENVFNIARDIREGRTKTDHKSKFEGKTGLFRGLIHCAKCGCAFSPCTNRHFKNGSEVKSESYYYCTNAIHKHKKLPRGTNDYKLTEQLTKLFESIKVPKKDFDMIIKTLTESHEGKKEFIKTEVANCRKQIDRFEDMIEEAYEDKCAGSITQDQYDKYSSKWRKKQDAYKARLETIYKADKEYYITAKLILLLAKESKRLFKVSKPDEKRQIITLTLRNLVVKDGKLYGQWKNPFDKIFKAKKGNTWGG
ncbi:recombinase family protein [Patescibacteria group bacterium]|nr:recombinase family protein [Patescibacteria group bacterium]